MGAREYDLLLTLPIMSNFIKEFGIVDQKIQDQLFGLIKDDQTTFQQSQLYSSVKDQKYVDTDERSSKYRLITNKKAFHLVDQLIKKINKCDKNMNYIVFKNNITHIVYKEGDFFKTHEDYLSITSNTVEEYTMIICMEANCEGGETIFHINEWFKYPSKSSVTTGHCMLFRKDLKHEGAVLKKGTKAILTLNLWGIPKATDKIVAVTFPNSVSPKYFISSSNIIGTNSLLESFLKTKSNADHSAKIFTYEEKNCDEKQFDVIYRIYQKTYITSKEYVCCSDAIKHHQLNIENILLDYPSDDKKISNVKPTFTFHDPIILLPSEEQAQHVLDVVKHGNLPYINFKMILAEGALSYGGEMTGTPQLPLNMTPMWVVFSDHENLLLKCKYMTTQNVVKAIDECGCDGTCDSSQCDIDLRYHIENLEKYDSVSGKITMEFDENYDENDDKNDKDEKTNTLNTKIQIDEQGQFEKVTYYGLELCQPKPLDEVFKDIIDAESDILPGDYIKPSDNQEKMKELQYYCIDRDGKVMITPKHYKRILEKIKQTNLLKAIRTKINSLKFILPQKKDTSSHHFCNEEVYGNANFLTVHGLLYLGDSE